MLMTHQSMHVFAFYDALVLVPHTKYSHRLATLVGRSWDLLICHFFFILHFSLPADNFISLSTFVCDEQNFEYQLSQDLKNEDSKDEENADLHNLMKFMGVAIDRR